MASVRGATIGQQSQRAGTITGHTPRGTTVFATGYTTGTVVPPPAPPPLPGDLDDPRNAFLVGDLL